MNLSNKKLILIAFCIIFFLICIVRANGYLLMDYFSESKYVVSVLQTNSLKDFITAFFYGQNREVGLLYFLIIKFFTTLFGGFSEFSVRFPSILTCFVTIFVNYYILSKILNKKFATISSCSLATTFLFIIYSSVSSPSMLATCFSYIAFLFLLFNIFKENNKKEYLCYFFLWFFVLSSVYTGGFSYFILNFLIICPVILFFKKIRDFLKPINFLPGILLTLMVLFVNLHLLYSLNTNGVCVNVCDFITPSILESNVFNNYIYYFVLSFYHLIIGVFPWLFIIIAMFFISIINLYKKNKIFKANTEKINTSSEERVLNLYIWAFLVSLFVYFVYSVSNFAEILYIIFYLSNLVAYFWYKNIYFDEYKKSVKSSSLFFYISLILFSVAVVLYYLFVTPIQKTYIEPLINPIILITLLVAIPGLIAIMLRRRLLNYSIHIVFSVLIYFFTTGLFYNYINSFGENDLVNFAIKARDDGAILVTYDIKNKYSMNYYYNGNVFFNGVLTAEEIYNNYGAKRNVYIVLKHTDLAYFDKFFVYEIIATGKQYCEITNVKYLPKDEVEENPDILPEKTE